MNKNVVAAVKPAASTRVVTGPRSRFSFCHIWEPKSINGGDPRYSMTVIIPKDDAETVDRINAAIEAAYRDGESKLKGKGALPPLSSIHHPLISFPLSSLPFSGEGYEKPKEQWTVWKYPDQLRTTNTSVLL